MLGARWNKSWHKRKKDYCILIVALVSCVFTFIKIIYHVTVEKSRNLWLKDVSDIYNKALNTGNQMIKVIPYKMKIIRLVILEM